MTPNRGRIVLFAGVLALLFCSVFAGAAQGVGAVSDGPYVRVTDDGFEMLRAVDGKPQFAPLDASEPFTVVSSDGRHSFEVTLREAFVPGCDYPAADKMTVLSDPHGNMDAFVSVLRSAGVIDGQYNWSYGDGHFVLLGDIFDRGDEVLPIFWLVYKLWTEAPESGGMVHFLPGNHESMVLGNDLRYVTEKYTALAEEMDIPYNELWTPDWVLGRWLATRNFIERIGSDLFVHAGLHRDLTESGLDIAAINDLMRRHLHSGWDVRKEDPTVEMLFTSKGPLWYRGIVRSDEERYEPITEEGLLDVLRYFGADRLFVGHTIFDEVSSFFDGRVIDVNVNNVKNMDAGRSRGVVVENGQLYLIYDDPQARKLWEPQTGNDKQQ